MAQQQQNGEPVMRRYVQFDHAISNSRILVTLQFRPSLTVISFARLGVYHTLSSHGAISITHFVRPSAILLPNFTIAPARTCVDSLACLELLHPGFYVACIGVPGPKTPPTKNSSPYRHPMPTFIVSRSILSRSGQPCISKTPLCSDHPLSVMPMLSHHVDARTPC
jgi:hypothetical protein